jgi:hypothetical protein
MDQGMSKPRRRRRMTVDERKEAMERRDEKIRLRMETYNQLREALALISGLPRAADMAQLVRLYDRSHYVKQRIPSIAQWMKEFEDAWNASESQRTE